MFEILAADADNEYAMIDSTTVGAHQHIEGQYLQRYLVVDPPEASDIFNVETTGVHRVLLANGIGARGGAKNVSGPDDIDFRLGNCS